MRESIFGKDLKESFLARPSLNPVLESDPTRIKSKYLGDVVKGNVVPVKTLGADMKKSVMPERGKNYDEGLKESIPLHKITVNR